MNAHLAKRILSGYIRSIVKARSNAIEACGGDDIGEDLAREMSPILWEPETDQFLHTCGAAHDKDPIEPGDVMNLTYLFTKMYWKSHPLAITFHGQVAMELQHLVTLEGGPIRAMRAVMS